MGARWAADAVLLLHAGFIAFVLLGGLLAWRWRRAPWLHLPAAAWGLFVEATDRICPLTLLENALRVSAGQAGYRSSFIEHHLLGLIYPEGLTREVQWTLAAVVLVVNAAIYGALWWRRRRQQAP
jgi:hypothetical protein